MPLAIAVKAAESLSRNTFKQALTLAEPATYWRVTITGVALTVTAYFSAKVYQHYHCAKRQQRVIFPGKGNPALLARMITVSLLLYMLTIAIGVLPMPWALPLAGVGLTLIDVMILAIGALLFPLRQSFVKPTANVAQHEYAVVPVTPDTPSLATRNVQWCTVWCGRNREGTMAFMAHFSATTKAADVNASVAEMLAHIAERFQETTALDSYLVGGWAIHSGQARRSSGMRQRIIRAAQQASFPVTVRPMPLTVCPVGSAELRGVAFGGLDVSMNCADGRLGYDSLAGPCRRSWKDLSHGSLTPASIMPR